MKISKSKGPVEKIKMKTKAKVDLDARGQMAEWWLAEDDDQLAIELCQTAAYLKTNQTWRLRQIATNVRLYSGLAVYNYAGSSVARLDRTKTLPDDKPTYNLIESVTDTIVSQLGMNEPQPKFLTDGADYKERHLAQQLNQFILGEFYQTNFYEKALKALRDCCVTGTGALKIYEGDEKKVCVDRVLISDLYVDENDCINGEPQTLYQLKLVNRDKLLAKHPKHEKLIESTPNSYPDNAYGGEPSISDQIMVVEGWKLPSGPDPEAPGYYPGRHTLACVNGIIHDEPWTKPKYPFVWLIYSDPFLGYFGRGIGDRLFGTQMTLNRILYTIARSIQLVGVPKVFVEQNSKVVKAHLDNQVGTIVTFSGTAPVYQTPPCNAQELYEERDRLISYGYQQEGVSEMQAMSQKPAGLNSGEAQRVYLDNATARFAALQKRYRNVFKDAAYLFTDVAMDIAKRDGKYQTIYPNKDGTKEIDLPKMKFLKDPFVIQCWDESLLPKEPAGRIETVTEQVQAGMLSVREGRRLIRYPDLEQNERLDNASEERILKYLDQIVEDGKYNPPDAFMDLQLALQLCTQYINLYVAANLEEEKADMLRDFFSQCQSLLQAAQPPPMPAPTPQAPPMPKAPSPLVPNAATPAA